MEGGTVNARELVVMAHVGTHRPEVGMVLKTCVPHLELTEPRKGSCPPPTFLSPARLYVVDILHLCYIHIHESMEMDCAHLRLWSLLCLSSWAPCLTWQKRKKNRWVSYRPGAALSVAVLETGGVKVSH